MKIEIELFPVTQIPPEDCQYCDLILYFSDYSILGCYVDGTWTYSEDCGGQPLEPSDLESLVYWSEMPLV
jgi:hypothetical protein